MLKVNFNYIKFNKNKHETLLLNNNFTISKNNIYTILGNNGSGKSTLLMAIIRMLNNNQFLVDGSVQLENIDIYELNDVELSNFRSKNFRLVFQDPVSAFDPLKKIKYYFNHLSASEAMIESELEYFQLPKYSEIKNIYPHQLSVGMLQRVNIILALIAEPKILMFDEPTSALDLPIINLVNNRLEEYVSIGNKMALLVTQDLLFAQNTSDYIAELTNGSLSDFLPVDKFLKTKRTR